MGALLMESEEREREVMELLQSQSAATMTLLFSLRNCLQQLRTSGKVNGDVLLEMNSLNQGERI
jgi:hypothetical protein